MSRVLKFLLILLSLLLLNLKAEDVPPHDEWILIEHALPDDLPEDSVFPSLLRSKSVSNAEWAFFIEQTAGDQMAKLVVTLSTIENYQETAMRGFLVWLEQGNLSSIRDVVTTLSPQDKVLMLRMFTMIPLQGTDLHFNLRVIKLLNALEMYKVSVDIGHRAWLKWPSRVVMSYVVKAAQEGKLIDSIWQESGVLLYSNADQNFRLIELRFGVELAMSLKRPWVAKELYKLAKLDDPNPYLAQQLAHSLHDLELKEELEDLLHGAMNPPLMYLRIKLVEEREPTELEWSLMIGNTTSPTDCHRLALELARYRSSREWDVLEHVLTFDDVALEIQVSTHYALARLAEKKGNFERAMQEYQAILDLSENDDSVLDPAKRATLAAALERMKENIEEGNHDAKRQIAIAAAAMQDRDLTRAEIAARKALEADPTSFRALSLLFTILKHSNQFDEMKALGDQIAKSVPSSKDEILAKAFMLIDVMKLDQALAQVNSLIEPGSVGPSRAYVAKAAIYERLGKFDEALKHLEQSILLSGDPSYRQKALLMAHSGDFAGAIRELESSTSTDAEVIDYEQLWLYILRSRSGLGADSAMRVHLAASASGRNWTKAIMRFMLGDISQDQLLKESRIQDDTGLSKGQLCEAWFYIGQRDLIEDRVEDARAAFQRAIDLNITVYIEHSWSIAELRRLTKVMH